jgi:hypothetical protein
MPSEMPPEGHLRVEAARMADFRQRKSAIFHQAQRPFAAMQAQKLAEGDSRRFLQRRIQMVLMHADVTRRRLQVGFRVCGVFEKKLPQQVQPTEPSKLTPHRLQPVGKRGALNESGPFHGSLPPRTRIPGFSRAPLGARSPMLRRPVSRNRSLVRRRVSATTSLSALRLQVCICEEF